MWPRLRATADHSASELLNGDGHAEGSGLPASSARNSCGQGAVPSAAIWSSAQEQLTRQPLFDFGCARLRPRFLSYYDRQALTTRSSAPSGVLLAAKASAEPVCIDVVPVAAGLHRRSHARFYRQHDQLLGRPVFSSRR